MGVRQYDPYYKNTQQLTKLDKTINGVTVEGATSELTEKLEKPSLTCRLMTYEMPANKAVKDYLRDALTTEFEAAKKLSPKGTPVKIVVNELDSDTSGFSKGTWTLDFTYKLDNRSENVRTVTEFASAYMGDAACRNTAQALEQALRENFQSFFSKL